MRVSACCEHKAGSCTLRRVPMHCPPEAVTAAGPSLEGAFHRRALAHPMPGLCESPSSCFSLTYRWKLMKWQAYCGCLISCKSAVSSGMEGDIYQFGGKLLLKFMHSCLNSLCEQCHCLMQVSVTERSGYLFLLLIEHACI